MKHALLLLTFAISSTAFGEFRATLASWEQLQAMKSKDRIEYLAKYRKIVIMMNKGEHDKKLVADVHTMDFNEQVAYMMNYFSIMPQAEAIDNRPAGRPAAPAARTADEEAAIKAEAQRIREEQKRAAAEAARRDRESLEQIAQDRATAEAERNANQRKDAAARTREEMILQTERSQAKATWNEDKGEMDCSKSNSATSKYYFEPRVGTCVILASTLNNAATGLDGGWSYWNKGTCPAGTKTVNKDKARDYCIPESSYNELAQAEKDKLASRTFNDPSHFKGMSKAQAEGEVLAASAKKEAAEKEAAAARGKKSFDEASAGNLAQAEKTNKETAAYFEEESKKVAAAKAAEEKKLAEAVTAAEKLASDKGAASTAGKDDGGKVPGGVGDDNCKKPAKRECPKNPNEDKMVQDWRKNDTDNACIIGGFFSTYTSKGSKEPGKCKAVSQFPPGSANPVKTCKANETLCNPFIFCVRKGEELVLNCVGRYYNGNDKVTERCEAFRTASKDQKCDPLDMLEGNAEKGVKTLKKDSIYRKEWERQRKEFTENFNKRCFPKENTAFSNLFCNECEIMKEVLFAENRKHFKSGCASKPVSEVKPAPAPPSGATTTGGGSTGMPPVQILDDAGTKK